MKPDMTFVYRPPVLTDLEGLLAIEKQAFTTDLLSRRQMRHWIQARNRNFLVCEEARSHTLAGYLLIFYRSNSHHARLYSIVVSKHFRGCGIARQLLARGEADARKHGCNSMRLEVSPHNKAAIGLYEALGYKSFALYKAFYEDGGDALRFQKRL